MQIFTDTFARYVSYVLRSHPNREEFDKRFDEILLKVISTRQWNVLHALSECKNFQEIAEWLSEREGSTISAEGVRKRAERALKTVTELLDKFVNSLKEQ
jgi:hypothetical protein